jgi:hypothetical protein
MIRLQKASYKLFSIIYALGDGVGKAEDWNIHGITWIVYQQEGGWLIFENINWIIRSQQACIRDPICTLSKSQEEDSEANLHDLAHLEDTPPKPWPPNNKRKKSDYQIAKTRD